MPDHEAILEALKNFAAAVHAKMNTLASGEPEDQLRSPFENLMGDIGKILAIDIVSTGESSLQDSLGRPDYAIHADAMLAGYVELKAPGTGANPSHFKGHNQKQWKRFQSIPNLIYTDGNEWSLFRSGEQERKLIRFPGNIETDETKAVTLEDAVALTGLLTDFLQWQPTIPTKSKGSIDLKAFAAMLAPLSHMLREDVKDALKREGSPLVAMGAEWRELLFPDADDNRFADEYAQTITFALLLARSEGADPLNVNNAEAALSDEHSLLGRALRILTAPEIQAEIAASLNLLLRVIAEVPPAALKSPREAWLFRHKDTLPMAIPEDPWLYFYEDFLAAYDPSLRKDAGAYYTPVEVVLAQVRLIDDLLTNRLGKPLGFADPDILTLDPAVGTGTYLLGVIDHALAKVHDEEGPGAVPGRATQLAKHIYGFELMAGPFAVSELRITLALQDWAKYGSKRTSSTIEDVNILLTDTLEGPHTPTPKLASYLKPISEQHAKALKVKAEVPVIVCLGNPPYDRHAAADGTNQARTGHWVRWGDDGTGTNAILKDFIAPAKEAGHGVHLKNLYNLYVYFWRWALWKVFDSKTAAGPGVVSYISASSYIDGDAFCGMREHMRRQCDEIWILDLGGEGRGTRQDDNVFTIQTPVAIAIAFRNGDADTETPATVRYARIEGKRAEKLKQLDHIGSLESVQWQECPTEWQAAFRPESAGKYMHWPELTVLFPWQHSGVQLKRTWPIGTTKEVLEKRWERLLTWKDRAIAFRETGDRLIKNSYRVTLSDQADRTPIEKLPAGATMPPAARFAYRSFDRQYVIADGRLMSRPRPDLWEAHSEKQVFLTTLLNHPLGGGPAITACAAIPDLHHFRGSYGAKEAMPIYRDAEATEPNILPGLLELLSKTFEHTVEAEDFAAYAYGVLAQPAFTEHFVEELGKREVRVPITKDAKLFEQARAIGATLLWLHTYGERFVPKGKQKGQVPKGKAKCTEAVPGDKEHYPEDFSYDPDTRTLHVGEGAFAPVDEAVYEFDVSGLKVVQSWLGYRMKEPKGKKSSPLDDINPEAWPSEFTTELLELLWVLEATLAEYPAQAKLLAKIVEGECFTEDELPDAPDEMRKPPKRKQPKGLFDSEYDSSITIIAFAQSLLLFIYKPLFQIVVHNLERNAQQNDSDD